MLTYPEAVQLLFQLERLGMKFGLGGISRLVRLLGNPHRKYPSIHIAGTNGKGSTAAMIAAVLSAAGFRTGLYTSPHLIHFEERIRVDGRPIPRDAVARLCSRLKAPILKFHPTFFEATTAIAFKYFADENVDVAVIETGLGGRLDSTNILRPILSVITNIGLEHTEILGNTIEKIAYEKAGIVKRKTPCVTGIRDPAALDVVRSSCRKMNAELLLATEYTTRVRKYSLDGMIVDFKSAGLDYRRLAVNLPGHYQLDNLGIALTALSVVGRRPGFKIPEDAIRKGLSEVRRRTGITGRLSVVQDRPHILVDVAHNADAIRKLIDALRRCKIRKPVVVFGVVRDKDYVTMVHDLAKITDDVVVVAAHSSRSRPAIDLVAAFEREGCKARAALSVAEGVALASRLTGEGRTMVVTGSHYVVGEALSALGRKRT